MKRLLAICGLVFFMFGCSVQNRSVDEFISLRNRVLQAEGCRFTTEITADYGDSIYTFALACSLEKSGDMALTVIEPETISGITARISNGTGKLTFDDKAVVFALVADEQITPISCPWIFKEALTGGYISASGKTDQGIYTQIDDSFSGVQFSVDIWTDEDKMPTRAEIIWDGKRILSMEIDDFEIL